MDGTRSIRRVIAGFFVDQLTQDVQVPGMPSSLLDHVDEHPAQRDRARRTMRCQVLDVELIDDLIGRGLARR